jgi:hypothetical protein
MKTIALLSAITLTSCATVKPVANDNKLNIQKDPAGTVVMAVFNSTLQRMIVNAIL